MACFARVARGTALAVCTLMRVTSPLLPAGAAALGLSIATALVSAQRPQPTSAGVLSEHHLEVLDSMAPQAQAEFLIERAINRYQGATAQIAARADAWRGRIELNERLNGLFMIALNSDDLVVRSAAIEVNLAALNVEKRSETIDRLEADARHGAQGPRANALWRIGLLGNRGVQPDRAFEILLGSIHDDNVNIRYWAVEGLAYLGAEEIITPLLSVFHDDPSPMIRERAACSLAQSGMLSAALRMTAVPRLLDFTEDSGLDDQTRGWVFQALRDITGQHLPRQPSAWRDWYVRSLRR
jgi:HEAT repeat protein